MRDGQRKNNLKIFSKIKVFIDGAQDHWEWRCIIPGRPPPPNLQVLTGTHVEWSNPPGTGEFEKTVRGGQP